MKRLKALVVLACITMGFANVARGQVYSSGYYYYHSETDDEMLILKFNGRTATLRNSGGPLSESIVRSNLKRDPNYYEQDFSGGYKGGLFQDIYEYYSTKGDYTIYRYGSRSWAGGQMTLMGYQPTYVTTWYYIAVSSNKETILQWAEDGSKTRYVKVDKSFYLPKDDFFDE